MALLVSRLPMASEAYLDWKRPADWPKTSRKLEHRYKDPKLWRALVG
jgi:hypothetical protein